MDKRITIIFIAIEIIAFLIFGGIYAVAQQIIRLSANLKPIEIVGNAAILLSKGNAPSSSVPAQYNVDIGMSLSPFLIIYDENKQPIAGNSTLNNKFPAIPKGVLDYARQRHENRITWQPQKNVRLAIAVRYFSYQNRNYYIVAGQSLREYEAMDSRISILVIMLFFGFSIACVFLMWMLMAFNKKSLPR